jgi:hypothetical protein
MYPNIPYYNIYNVYLVLMTVEVEAPKQFKLKESICISVYLRIRVSRGLTVLHFVPAVPVCIVLLMYW